MNMTAMTKVLKCTIAPRNTHIRLSVPVISFVTLLINIHSASAIVTSDDPERHVVTPGQIVAGLNLDGVAQITIPHQSTPDPFFDQKGSAVLAVGRTGKKFILTAAHLFNDLSDIDDFRITWEVPDDTITVFSSRNDVRFFPSSTTYNINVTDRLIQNNYNPLIGFDIALIELGESAQLQLHDVLAYEIGPRSKDGLIVSMEQLVIAGYGNRGQGGDSGEVSGTSGTKRWGYNRYERTSPSFIINEFTQIAYDYDSGNAGQDYFGRNYNIVDTGYGDDEVMHARVDSGGPSFLNGKVVGIHSYRERMPIPVQLTDINGDLDSSWGEYGVDTNVTYEPIWNWINRFASSTRHNEAKSNTSWEDVSAWSGESLPTPTETAAIDSEVNTSVAIFGPTNSFNLAGVIVGTGQGDKALLLENGGSLTMPGDFLVDTNGFVELSDGDVTADRLVVQGLTPVLVPPSAQPGAFVWNDTGNNTSLTVDQIIVNLGGQFFFNRSGPLALANTDYEMHGGVIDTVNTAFHVASGRTLTMTGGNIVTPELRIESNAVATVTDATSPAIISTDLVTVLGTLEMHRGQVQGDDLTMDSGGQLKISVGGLTPGSGFGSFILTGDATLAGTLVVEADFDTIPNLFETFAVIAADTVTGEFGDADIEVFTARTFAMLYEADSFLLELIPLLTGDANNDGVVDAADMIAVEQNFGTLGVNNGSLLGDANDDGRVDGGDWLAIERNFGSVWVDPLLTPEPGVGGLVLLMMAVACRQLRSLPCLVS